MHLICIKMRTFIGEGYKKHKYLSLYFLRELKKIVSSIYDRFKAFENFRLFIQILSENNYTNKVIP